MFLQIFQIRVFLVLFLQNHSNAIDFGFLQYLSNMIVVCFKKILSNTTVFFSYKIFQVYLLCYFFNSFEYDCFFSNILSNTSYYFSFFYKIFQIKLFFFVSYKPLKYDCRLFQEIIFRIRVRLLIRSVFYLKRLLQFITDIMMTLTDTSSNNET